MWVDSSQLREPLIQHLVIRAKQSSSNSKECSEQQADKLGPVAMAVTLNNGHVLQILPFNCAGGQKNGICNFILKKKEKLRLILMPYKNTQTYVGILSQTFTLQ